MEIVNMAVSSFAFDGNDLTVHPAQLMSRYYFHLVRGRERIPDLEGLEMTDGLLPVVVTKVVREILAERPDLRCRNEGWSLEIVDAAGHEVQTIQL
jgi:hypothetical protein